MARKISGSCLCGSVRFEFTGVLRSLQACHCSRCRKFYGGAFGPVAIVDRDGFSYMSGEDNIASFRSSERVNRYFCRTCGSPLPLVEPWDPLVGVPAGLLDDDPGRPIDSHIFVGSKATWYSIADAAPQHDEWPPDEDMNARFESLTSAAGPSSSGCS
jgi:hypothetical protein